MKIKEEMGNGGVTVGVGGQEWYGWSVHVWSSPKIKWGGVRNTHIHNRLFSGCCLLWLLYNKVHCLILLLFINGEDPYNVRISQVLRCIHCLLPNNYYRTSTHEASSTWKLLCPFVFMWESRKDEMGEPTARDSCGEITACVALAFVTVCSQELLMTKINK